MASPTPQPISVVIDTNVLLHFKQPDQIDWTPVGNDVVLLILPVVVRELEKAKAVGVNQRVKQRAAKVIAWLGTLLQESQQVQLRDGVAILFLERDAQLDFAHHNLVREIQDDHVIASMIELKAQQPLEAVLCTADLGLRMKAKPRGIALFVPPENERLAEEADPKDKENAQLRRELHQLTSKLPRLKVTSLDGDVYVKPASVAIPAAPMPFEEIDVRHPAMAVPKPAASSVTVVGMLQSFSVPGEPAVGRYNQQRAEYLEKYRKYVADFEAWSNIVRRCILFDLQLKNTGTMPASGIDVILTFPHDLRVRSASDVPRAPKAPVAPQVPTNAFGSFESTIPLMPNLHGTRLPDEHWQRWDVVCKENRAHLKLGRLKHGFDEPIPTLALVFAGLDTRSISLSVEVTVNELMSATKHELHVVVGR